MSIQYLSLYYLQEFLYTGEDLNIAPKRGAIFKCVTGNLVE